MKRVAAHYLYIVGHGYLKQWVVELQEGRVVGLVPLAGEVEDTLWMPGLIALCPEELAADAACAAQKLLDSGFSKPSVVSDALADELLPLCRGRRALYFPRFNFEEWRPVCETQHMQWL